MDQWIQNLLTLLIGKFSEDDSKYLIGSRFVKGGGYKGQTPGSNNLLSFIKV